MKIESNELLEMFKNASKIDNDVYSPFEYSNDIEIFDQTCVSTNGNTEFWTMLIGCEEQDYEACFFDIKIINRKEARLI